MQNKFQIVIESSNAFLEEFDTLTDALDRARVLSKTTRKNDILLIKESKSGEVLSRFGILLD